MAEAGGDGSGSTTARGDHGCAAYMWDMLKKEIHVLESLCTQVPGGVQRHMIHKESVSQIQSALFSCLCDKSRMCMLHAIRQYDGDKMMWPLMKGS
uniref:Uncharacterized protein n=1 Tax=Aegilops tauschii TaxID=37682 RepID=M8BS00_AEGTA